MRKRNINTVKADGGTKVAARSHLQIPAPSYDVRDRGGQSNLTFHGSFRGASHASHDAIGP